MIDSTNPRVMADNIRHLSGESGSQASDISALQTTVTDQGNAIEALGTYSTVEVDTGMKLGDDTIYRKVFNLEGLPNATTDTIPHGISNLGLVTILYGVAQKTATYQGRMFPFSNLLLVHFDASNIYVTSTVDRSDVPGIVVIEYTKSAPSSLTSPAPDDSRSIENEDPDIRSEEIEPEVNEEAPEEEPVVETKTTRKKSTSTK